MRFTELPDLAVRELTGAVLAANDEAFAEKECLVRGPEPVFTPHSFGNKGQIYDGWETRRRREPGHDWALIRLGVPGVVRGVVVDTAFFKGNYPPEISVQGCTWDGYPSVDDLAAAKWVDLVPRAAAAGDTKNEYTVEYPGRVTHVRLNMFPDGGVARLRVHGEPAPDPSLFGVLPLDLAAMANGGTVVSSSDAFYSRAWGAIMPGNASCQADGWETSRRRDDGNDHLVLRLAGRGVVTVAELDTSHLKFNSPAAAALRGCDTESGGDLADPGTWFDLLPRTRLQADTPHRFAVADATPITHVRLDIYPDGGMSRVRMFGKLTAESLRKLKDRHVSLNSKLG